ncbi:hypothetical protein LX16_1285 [Stackebrandtia albiflava]|uniref:Uncharacterized protein n=1 Tax=Stackebrandtia albiflava TaxID=406432 RepID=A0A562VCG8_9ACTN|nr:hypothetical protein [Stackebrandtia albiflava]TWJ15574.1 hypothetical protein LX16_1285 [Stackebrandtia albiflava]
MTTYTVRIERQARETDTWETVVADEPVSDTREPAELCDDLALMETLADGREWRVRVWHGDSASTGAPAAERRISRLG